jgi:hypothetical protein
LWLVCGLLGQSVRESPPLTQYMTLHKCEVSCFWAEPIKRKGHYRTWEKWSIQPWIVGRYQHPNTISSCNSKQNIYQYLADICKKKLPPITHKNQNFTRIFFHVYNTLDLQTTNLKLYANPKPVIKLRRSTSCSPQSHINYTNQKQACITLHPA